MAMRRLALLLLTMWVLGLGGGSLPCVCAGHGGPGARCHGGEDVQVCAQVHGCCGTCNVDPRPGSSPSVPKTPGHVSSGAGQAQILWPEFLLDSVAGARLTLETSDKGPVRAWGISIALLSPLYLLKASLLC